jgi:hypothetical protein
VKRGFREALRRSRGRIERVVDRGVFLGFGESDAGNFFKQFDVGDEAVIDDFLREIHELGLGPDGRIDAAALLQL